MLQWVIIQALGESKIDSMMESKEFRKGIVQLEWEHKKNLMRIEDLKNKMRIINMMKVTREIQSYLSEDDHDAKIAQEVNILEQTIALQRAVSCLIYTQRNRCRILKLLVINWNKVLKEKYY